MIGLLRLSHGDTAMFTQLQSMQYKQTLAQRCDQELVNMCSRSSLRKHPQDTSLIGTRDSVPLSPNVLRQLPAVCNHCTKGTIYQLKVFCRVADYVMLNRQTLNWCTKLTSCSCCRLVRIMGWMVHRLHCAYMVLDLLYVALVCGDTEKQHGGTSHVFSTDQGCLVETFPMHCVFGFVLPST